MLVTSGQRLTASVANLDTSLADVYGDDFTHSVVADELVDVEDVNGVTGKQSEDAARLD
jgi:hypothetical protein